MRNLIERARARKNHLAAASAVALTAAMVPGTALATTSTYDLSPATNSVTDQVTSVLTTALPIAGGLIALTVGWKLIKKMVKSA